MPRHRTRDLPRCPWRTWPRARPRSRAMNLAAALQDGTAADETHSGGHALHDPRHGLRAAPNRQAATATSGKVRTPALRSPRSRFQPIRKGVYLAVEDDGPGVAAADLPHLTQRFIGGAQAHDARQRPRLKLGQRCRRIARGQAERGCCGTRAAGQLFVSGHGASAASYGTVPPPAIIHAAYASHTTRQPPLQGRSVCGRRAP